MSKTVSKIIWNSLWDFGRKESWLTDMAAKGLRLTGIKGFFGTFSVENPSNVKHCIKHLMDSPSKEDLKLYEQNGWRLVASRDHFYIFSSKTMGFKEIRSLNEDRECMQKAMDKSLKVNLILFVAMALLTVFFLWQQFFATPTPVIQMLFDAKMRFLTLPLLFLAIFAQALRNYVVIAHSKRELFRERHGDAPWRGAHAIDCVLSVAVALAILSSYLLPTIPSVMGKTYTLPTETTDLPIVRLADIEGVPGDTLVRSQERVANGIDWGNFVSQEFKLLTSVYTESKERAVVSGAAADSLGKPYAPSVDCLYIALPVNTFTAPLFRELSMIEQGVLTEKQVKSLPSSLSILANHTGETILLSKDNAVLIVSYNGRMPREKVEELTQQVMQLQ